MLEQSLDCLVENADTVRPLYAVRPAGLAAFLDGLPSAQSGFLRQLEFTGAAQELQFLPGEDGVAGAVLGLGDDTSPNAFGNLAYRLPEGAPWQLQPGDYQTDAAVQPPLLSGWCVIWSTPRPICSARWSWRRLPLHSAGVMAPEPKLSQVRLWERNTRPSLPLAVARRDRPRSRYS